MLDKGTDKKQGQILFIQIHGRDLTYLAPITTRKQSTLDLAILTPNLALDSIIITDEDHYTSDHHQLFLELYK